MLDGSPCSFSLGCAHHSSTGVDEEQRVAVPGDVPSPRPRAGVVERCRWPVPTHLPLHGSLHTRANPFRPPRLYRQSIRGGTTAGRACGSDAARRNQRNWGRLPGCSPATALSKQRKAYTRGRATRWPCANLRQPTKPSSRGPSANLRGREEYLGLLVIHSPHFHSLMPLRTCC